LPTPTPTPSLGEAGFAGAFVDDQHLFKTSKFLNFRPNPLSGEYGWRRENSQPFPVWVLPHVEKEASGRL
jgi:hypothetical protein